MSNLVKVIKSCVGGFEIVGAKKIVREINKAFESGTIPYTEFKACKDALVDNLTYPEHDRIKILNMFKI